MNKLLWCVNVLLLLFAVTATLAALHNEPAKAVPAALPAGRERPELLARATPAPMAGQPRAELGKTDLLWQASLFRPDRAEEDESAGPVADAGGRLSEMELIGIGMIGGEAAAIIAIGDKEVGPVRLPKLVPGRGPVAEPVARKGVPHVFRLGQAVADSGFEIKSIEMEQVVLTHGAEERVLKIDRRDAGSRRRNELAAREAMTRAPPPVPQPANVATGVAPAAPGAVPPPPPPPGTNVNPGAVSPGSITAISRAARVEAALKERRRILESRGLQQP